MNDKLDLQRIKQALEKELELLFENFKVDGSEIQQKLHTKTDQSDLARQYDFRQRRSSLDSIAEAKLSRIEQALQRLDNGTYGICLKCGKDIQPGRLRALPYAEMCIECQAEEEKKYDFQNIFAEDDLKRLFDIQGNSCISFYMHTHRGIQESRQDRIRYKELLKWAEKRLENYDLGFEEARNIIEQAQQLLGDGLFWCNQNEGLVVFLTEDQFLAYLLPVRFKELVVVASSFFIKPLIHLLSRDGHFFILVLSQYQIRLYQGSRFGVGEVGLEGTPTSLAFALQYDDPERQLQFHTGTNAPGRRKERLAIFHGHSAAEQDEKTNLLRFFHKVDDGIRGILSGQHIPLILVGVDYLLPIYRQANTHLTLLEESISGNLESMNIEDLHRAAWTIVKSYYKKDQQGDIDRYLQLKGQGDPKASDDLLQIIHAAVTVE